METQGPPWRPPPPSTGHHARMRGVSDDGVIGWEDNPLEVSVDSGPINYQSDKEGVAYIPIDDWDTSEKNTVRY